MFLRPSSAHYTYHPAATPARDQRAYKDLPMNFYGGLDNDFDFVPSRGRSLRRQHHHDLTPEARYARAMEEARAAQQELRAQAEDTQLRDEARALKDQVAQLRAERMREEARLNQLRREEARLAEALRAEAHAVQVARERERRAAEAAQQEARRRELVARRRAALQQQEQARAAVRQLFTTPAHSQPPQTQPQRYHVTFADLLERSVASQLPTPARSVPAPAPAVKAESVRVKPSEQAVHDFLSALFGPQVTTKQDKPAPATQAPAPQDKGKAKAASEPECASAPAPVHSIVQQRLEERLARETEQEMADTARAILNSLRDQGGVNATHATSSKVTVENAPKSASTSSAPTPRRASPAPPAAAPAFPLERIQSISDTLNTLRTFFHFPATPDFDTAGALSYSAANTPVRAYEHALGGLLEQLDGVESAGDEAVRARRREVVKEVERALEELDERVRAASPAASRAASPAAQTLELEKVEEAVAVAQQDVEVAVEEQASSEPIAEAEAHLVQEPVEDGAATRAGQEKPVPAPVLTSAPTDSVVPSSTCETTEESAVVDAATDAPAAADVPYTEAVSEAPASTEAAPVHYPTPVEEQTATVEQLSANQDPAEAISDLNVRPASTPDSSCLLFDAPVQPHSDDAPKPFTPSSPQPDPSDSFLASLARPISPSTPEHADADDELEDSVMIEKEEHSSERSWSDVESESA